MFNVPNADAFQEFFVGQSQPSLQLFFILDADGNVRGNNRQFARAAQGVLRLTF